MTQTNETQTDSAETPALLRPLPLTLAYGVLGLIFVGVSFMLPISQATAVAIWLAVVMLIELVRLSFYVRQRVASIPWLYAFTVAAVVVVTAVMAALVLFGMANGIVSLLPAALSGVATGLGLLAIAYIIIRMENGLADYIMVGIFKLPVDENNDTPN